MPRAGGAADRGLIGLLGLVVACAVALAPGQPQPLNVQALRERIQKLVSDGTTPSVAVAAARDGRILWSEAFGFADRDARVPSTVDTPYSIASGTKPFTATAVMILAERHRLALDEPVSRYLGSLVRPGVGSPADVTLRRTLGHTAGFPLHYQYFFDDEPHRPLSFDDTMRCYGAEIQTPGSRYTYSNLGYGALGEIVARVSGQQYRDFLAREIFQPLGLTHASVPERVAETAGAAEVRPRRWSVAVLRHRLSRRLGNLCERRGSGALRLVSRGCADGWPARRAPAPGDRRDADARTRRLWTRVAGQPLVDQTHDRLAQRCDAGIEHGPVVGPGREDCDRGRGQSDRRACQPAGG